jgi:signal transduction histidine kinase
MRMIYLRIYMLLLLTGMFLQPNMAIGADEGQNDTTGLSGLVTEAMELSNSNPQKAKELVFGLLGQNEVINNKLMLSRLHSVLGYSYINIGQNDSAMIYARLASDLYEEGFGHDLNFYNSNLMGRLHHEFQQYDSALYYFDIIRELGQEQNSLNWLAAAYNNMGMVYDSKGDLRQSFDHYVEALKFYESSNNLKNAAIVLNNLGIINQTLGEYEKSIEYFKRAVGINNELKALVDLSMNYSNLGITYKELGRLDEALDMYKMSLNIAIENNLSRDQARIHLNMGNVHKAKGKNDLAEMSYRESLRLCEENEIIFGVMLNNYALGYLFLKTGRYENAEKFLLEALQISLKAGHQITVMDSYRDLSVVYENLGKFDQALQFNRRLMKLSDSLNDINHRGYVIDLQTRYETERKELENISLRLENDNKAKTIRLQLYFTFFGGLTILLLTLLVIMIFKSRQRVRRNNDRLSVLNDKYQQQNQMLEETNSTKDKLFSLIAHDLRSPFSSMLGFLQLLSEDFDSMSDQEKKKVLESLFKQSSNTYSLIENLMTWAMNQRGQLQYQPGYHDLLDIVSQEIEFLMSRAESKSIHIENTIPEGRIAFVDKDMVRVIFRNLINNAIKFTKEQGSISIGCVALPDELQVSITDTGRGMTPEEIKLVFHNNTFYSSQGTKDEKGTGLGLLIVKDFADKNNIRLEVSSNPGKGTILTLHIPVHE